MVIVLAALIALFGSQILDGLRAKRERADILILKLEEVSEKVEKLYFDEVDEITKEIRKKMKHLKAEGKKKAEPTEAPVISAEAER